MSKSVCEEDNFNAIYRGYALRLRNFVYYRAGDLERSEDIVQEAMIRLWENCAGVAYEKVQSFLYTVCNRLLIDRIRHDKVRLEFVRSAPDHKSEDASFSLEKKEFEKKLQDAISALPSTQREAFLMNRIDKLSYAEIAEMLDISVKAVEKRIHLALKTLKENVKELKIHKI